MINASRSAVDSAADEAPPVDIGESILFDADAERITRLSRTTRWRLAREGKFPSPFRLSNAGGRIGYLRSEILDWMRERAETQRVFETV